MKNYILVTLFLFGCGDDIDANRSVDNGRKVRPTDIDESLRTFVEEYKLELKARDMSLMNFQYLDSVKYDDMETDKWGWAERWSDSKGLFLRVRISNVLKNDPIYTRAVVFHELGHAIQSASHSSDPKSIMYWRMEVPYRRISKDWNSVKEDFFQDLKKRGFKFLPEEGEYE